jgi:hypothetical protein
MTTTITSSARANMLDGFETFMLLGSGTANLTLYQGAISLCVFPLAAAPFGAGNASSLVLASTPISSTGTEVAGNANRWVITNQNGDTGASGTLSALGGGGDLETDNLTITAAATQTLNALVMRMATDGGIYWEGSLTLV